MVDYAKFTHKGKTYYVVNGKVVYPGDLCQLRHAHWYDSSKQSEDLAQSIEDAARGKGFEVRS